MSFELSMILKTTVVLISAWFICFVLRRRVSASARHTVWTIAVWAALAVPGLSFILPSLNLRLLPPPPTIAPAPLPDSTEQSIPFPAAASDSRLSFPLRAMTESTRPSTAISNPLTWRYWIALAWGLGALVVVARLLAGTLQIRRLRKDSRSVIDDSWLQLLAELRGQLSVTKRIDLRIAMGPIPPMTWGIFQPVVLMPQGASQWSRERRRLVLAHELAHVQRNDGWTQIVAQLACSIYWLNPLIWYAAYRMRVERERACDDSVLGLGASAEDYADHLLQIARTLNSGFSFAAVAMAHPSQLESRLTSILDPLTRRQKLSRVATSFLLACVVVLTASAAALQIIALAPLAVEATARMTSSAALQPVAVTLLAQQNGLASIGGGVSKIGSGEALPGTRVDLIKSPAGGPAAYTATTSAEGAFLISGIQPGEYRLLATRDDGLLPAEYGQKAPGVRGLPITVGAGASLRDIKIAMASPGAISGRIFDRSGDAVGHAQVQALRSFYRDGVRMLSIAQSVQTNDLGEYRLFWLAPGQYYITASLIDTEVQMASMYIRRPEETLYHDETNGPVISRRVLESGEIREEVHPPMYFPGTTDIRSATKVDVRAGADLRGTDIRLTGGVPARRIRGVVIDSSKGQPAAGASVIAIPENSGPYIVIPNGKANPAGVFEISGVAPGSYFLFATFGGGIARGGPAARLRVEVGGEDLQNVTLNVPQPFDLPGRFVVEGKSDIDLTRLQINIRQDPDIFGMPNPQQDYRAGTANPNATRPDGSFTLAGVGAGDFRIGVTYSGIPTNGTPLNFSPGTYLKSIRLGTSDVLKNGLHLDGPPQGRVEIVLGVGEGAIAGSVVNDKKENIPNVVVTLVPDATLRFRTDLYRTVATDVSGHFDLKNVPPGDYKIFAWDDAENGSWLDPEFLKNYESLGMPVHIVDSGRESKQLTVISVRR